MARFQVYENDRLVTITDDWKTAVKGLNSAQDIIDADYQKIEVRQGGKLVYSQPRTRVP